MTASSLVTLVIGLATLLFGRQLFWLFVGATGFAVGARVAADVWRGEAEWVIVLAALGVGVLGALLAALLELTAAGLAGFLAGAYGVLSALRLFGVESGGLLWLVTVLGGVLGAALALLLLGWALIALSSIVGAALLAPLGRFGPAATAAIFVVLVVVGVAVQASRLAAGQPTQPGPARR